LPRPPANGIVRPISHAKMCFDNRSAVMVSATTTLSLDRAKVWQLCESGQLAAARALCQEILRKTPDDLETQFALATTLLKDGHLQDGIAVLRSLLNMAPEHQEARFNLGRALLLSGQADEGIGILQNLLVEQPDNAELALELAGAFAKRGETLQAIGLMEGALLVAPSHIGLLNNLGGLLVQEDRLVEAHSLFERALTIDPQQPLAHYNLANLLRQQGQPDLAVGHYRRALALNPDFVEAWQNLGNHLLDLGRVKDALKVFQTGTKARRLSGKTLDRTPTANRTCASKLAHDVEQFRYLMDRGLLPQSFEETLTHYEDALAALPKPQSESHVVDIPVPYRDALKPTYNRLLHWQPAGICRPTAVNPELDRHAIQADYAANAPGITFFDGLLTPEALASLRKFCLESTMWFEYRYANGYVGAFMDDGFACPLLYQISEELRLSLPEIFRHHTLRKLWAFKYDSRLSGIPIHADFAAVNVNFWVTPDDANLDPETGGLKVWDKEAPAEWDFAKYNANESAMRGFLEESGARAVNVPHRQNRAVIFNSDLFHETGELNFREGYENRRINITMLYGKRDDV